MLTADLVDVRRRGGRLELARLDAARRARVCAIGGEALAVARAHEGRARGEVEAALSAIEVGPREHRLRDALVKLVLDDAAWDEPDAERAEAVRRAVFVRASSARQAGAFSRERVLEEAAAELGMDAAGTDAALFSDLREAARLARASSRSAEALAGVYEHARAQAVLLRATKVRVMMRCGSPHAARAVFRAIKFLGLVHTLVAQGDGSHLLEVDGPYSIFESVTKYGLKLALLLPALDACEAYALEAQVRWGRERTPLVFEVSGGRGAAPAPTAEPHAELAASLVKLGLSARLSEEILDLPGVGLCVPDLEASARGRVAFVEVLGFWSRAAVWKRVELVEKGLAPPMVFCVSSRLRVSEDALPEDAPSALYVYKGTISPRALAAKIEAVLAR